MTRLDAVDPLDLLPANLRALSLSDCEIVLPYEEAIQALELCVAARWGLLAWEGWVKYPSGVGHHSDYQGTVELTRMRHGMILCDGQPNSVAKPCRRTNSALNMMRHARGCNSTSASQ